MVEGDGKLLELTLSQHRESLTLAGRGQGPTWLEPSLGSSEGTAKIYEVLQEKVESESFLSKLIEASSTRVFPKDAGEAPPGGTAAVTSFPQADVSKEAWWEVVGKEEDPAASRVSDSPEPLDKYVMVEHEDVVDAIAYFIASYVAAQPQAAKMEPKQLQAALGLAFFELRKGQIKRLWDWGKSLYRCAAVGSGLLSVYTNPWLVNALLSSLFTGSRVVCGLLLP
mmetsp:Transcript_29000/g.92593  ORF Transcript_29000/g.92593 Transcript_29000/m.92593 type:complete len:225 (+) Transcript_29000:171-845(+)